MRRPSASAVLAWLVLAVGLGLGAAVLALPAGPTDLRARVDAALGDSGVEHPVTAVLLNYRAYDTLLELGVFLLALAGTWSFRLEPVDDREPAGPLQVALVRALVPVMVLVAGHLLWLGSAAPGGAFQAGAVLGGAGVLLLVSQPPLVIHGGGIRYRALASLGLLVFLAVAVATLERGQLLEYRGDTAAILILLIEAAAALSIGAILAALFAAAEDLR
jgi:multisubunit Na+/H+ antiporter MnhB subunit